MIMGTSTMDKKKVKEVRNEVFIQKVALHLLNYQATNKISLKEMANSVEVTERTLYKHMGKVSFPEFDVLAKYRKIFHLDINKLVDGEDENRDINEEYINVTDIFKPLFKDSEDIMSIELVVKRKK